MTTTEDRDYLPAMAHTGHVRLYDTWSRLLGSREAHWRLLVQAGVEPASTVLEIGCGTGNVLLLAARAVPGATLIGLDPDPQALAIAARKAEKAGAAVRWDRGFADRLPYPDGSVDRVLSAFMLHHLPEDQQAAALREVRRVLAPGGRLHVVDFDGVPDGPVGRLLHLGRSHDHGHGHGQSHGDLALTFTPVQDALTAAGFADVAHLGDGRTPMGRHGFFRATR
jgi:ubiquinone/menaquinone biosynthesis C-methylase UbiE